jgi:hypothetical protein
MKWITREKVKVDRVVFPWLIKKFLDPNAECLFLPHDTDWTSIRDGILYDVPDCELGHHGEEVSFGEILRMHRLTNDPALILLAQIVSGPLTLIQATRILQARVCAGSPTVSAHLA